MSACNSIRRFRGGGAGRLQSAARRGREGPVFQGQRGLRDPAVLLLPLRVPRKRSAAAPTPVSCTVLVSSFSLDMKSRELHAVPAVPTLDPKCTAPVAPLCFGAGRQRGRCAPQAWARAGGGWSSPRTRSPRRTRTRCPPKPNPNPKQQQQQQQQQQQHTKPTNQPTSQPENKSNKSN